MSNQIDGFYAAFLTAGSGQGLALLQFVSTVIIGADSGGVKYDGSYSIDEVNTHYDIDLTVTIPPGTALVQGIKTGPVAESYQLKASLPPDFADLPFVRIDGKNGPVNAKFRKLRDLT